MKLHIKTAFGGVLEMMHVSFRYSLISDSAALIVLHTEHSSPYPWCALLGGHSVYRHGSRSQPALAPGWNNSWLQFRFSTAYRQFVVSTAHTDRGCNSAHSVEMKVLEQLNITLPRGAAGCPDGVNQCLKDFAAKLEGSQLNPPSKHNPLEILFVSRIM